MPAINASPSQKTDTRTQAAVARGMIPLAAAVLQFE